MISVLDKSNCSGCYACVNVCLKQCISIYVDQEGFSYPYIDQKQCVKCGICSKACPILTPVIKLDSYPLAAIAAYCQDCKIREQSSSGGIFTLLADYILDSQGIIFGAAFDDEFFVRHIAVEKREDLHKLRGSKYAQSTIGNCYKKAKKELNNNRPVLFSGTPCQIAGLQSFLGKEYSNLYTVDLICHGVPSPLVWKKYISYRESIANSKTYNIKFREKNLGWTKSSLLFEFGNRTQYHNNVQNDVFLQGFLKNIYLRPSCHDCRFKGIKRHSDITLADYWGIDTIHPELFDDKGISLLLIQSEKGTNLWRFVKSQTKWIETDLEKAIHNNLAAIRSAVPSKNRGDFFKALQENSKQILFDKTLPSYTKPTFEERLKKSIIFVLSKLNLLTMTKKIYRKTSIL